MDTLAGIFRRELSHIITTNCEVLRKLLKTLIPVARFFRNQHLRSLRGHSCPKEILFDKDIGMHVDASRAMGSSFYWFGFHEYREFLFLRQFLTAEMVGADVGANMGEYALFMAKRLTLGKVFAFEPMPDNRQCLEKNIAKNHFTNIQVEAIGLSDAAATMTMYEIDDQHEGLNTFYLGERKPKRNHKFEVQPFDTWAQAMTLPRLDFMKIDVEGSELPVLCGARRSISQFRPLVQVEINALTAKAAGYTITDIFNFFEDLRYRPHNISKRGTLQPLRHIREFENVIFVPIS